MTASGRVHYERQGRVAAIVLDRPDKLNALDPAMLDQLDAAVAAFEADGEARVAVLRGEGRAFCVGADLGSASSRTGDARPSTWEDRARLRAMAATWLRFWDTPKPVIAQVHGHAIAAGVQLAVLCDLTVVDEGCRFGWPKLPMGAGFIGPMVANFVGVKHAKELSMVVGSTMSGREAADWGFANRAVPADELAPVVDELARRMALLPISMLELKKAAINRVWNQTGFRERILASAEWDAVSHEDPAVLTMREWIQADGIAGAIQRFEDGGL